MLFAASLPRLSTFSIISSRTAGIMAIEVLHTEGAPRMELRVLRYFLAVAEEGNITWAAQLLRISQPTLSRQLKQLEEELSVTLFERGSHTITLTEEGRLLRECAQTKSIRVPAHRHYRALVSDGSRKPPAGGTRIVDPAESQGCAAAVPGAHARTQSATELVRAIRRSRRSSTPGITRRNAPMSFSRNW